jgi:glycosyltransferase involved in cell wall biosynthesis
MTLAAGQVPLVTVVMPVRNEATHVARSLRAVLAQDYPAARLEVVVADGMSSDGTRETVARLAAEDPRVRLVDNPGLIAPTGLNAALRQAAGEFIVRVDGHCEIAPDYVSRCIAHLQSGQADGVGGSVETVGETPAAEAIALAMSSRFGVGNSAFRTLQGRTVLADTIPFPAYPRPLIDRVGLYDEELVRDQDEEYNYRIRAGGGRLLLAADVRSRYYSRSSVARVWRQYFQYGFWKVRVLQKHPRQMRLRQFVPPAFVAGLALLGVAAAFRAEARTLLAGVLAAYVASAVVAALVVSRGRWRLAPAVAATFPALHLGYGAGFLVGLVRFARKWSRPDSARPRSESEPLTKSEVRLRHGGGES